MHASFLGQVSRAGLIELIFTICKQELHITNKQAAVKYGIKNSAEENDTFKIIDTQ